MEEGLLPPSWGQFSYLVQGTTQPGTWLEGLKSITQGSARWDTMSQNYCQRWMQCMSALPERWSRQGKWSYRGLHVIPYVPTYLWPTGCNCMVVFLFTVSIENHRLRSMELQQYFWLAFVILLSVEIVLIEFRIKIYMSRTWKEKDKCSHSEENGKCSCVSLK